MVKRRDIISSLVNKLKELNIPVASHGFKSKVEPPFLVYYVTEQNNFLADNQIFKKSYEFTLELYNSFVDISGLEEDIIELLDESGIIFNMYDGGYIQQEHLYVTVFTFALNDIIKGDDS